MKFLEKGGVRYLTFDIFPQNVKHAVFTRSGGISPSPWDSLNVGGTVGDAVDNVRQNRYSSFLALDRDPLSIFDVWQVHSDDVVIANKPHPRRDVPPVFKADGIVTDNETITLFMRFADCTPILLYDPIKKVAGIVHAGWQGTVKKAVASTIKTMRNAYGCRPADILAGIGPAIGPDHYQVGADVVERVNYAFGKASESVIIYRDGKTYFDLWKANQLVLLEEGVQNIEVAGICTACEPENWFSHRGQNGKTGRFGALIAFE